MKPVLDDYDERRKSNRLLQDLQAVGVTTPPTWYTHLPAIENLSAALGCFYVMESYRKMRLDSSQDTINRMECNGGSFWSSLIRF